MTIEQAIELLKPFVKMSHVKNQAHLDLGLAPTKDLDKYQEALVVLKQAVNQKIIGQKEVDEALGL